MSFGVVNGASVSMQKIFYMALSKTSNCFNFHLFIPLLREGFPPQGYKDDQMHDTQHWTDEAYSRLLLTRTHSSGEANTVCYVGP